VTLVVVLAGGLSRRMGSPKAVVPLGGKPLIAWPLAAASAAGLEAVVVAKPGSALPPLEVPVWDEPEAPSHPLTGLVAALAREGGPVVALACDMPFVSPGLIARLAAARGVAAPAGEAFPARYEPSALTVLRAGLAREAAVRAVLAELGAAPVEADPGELVGINDPDALARAEAALS
jgi:molybdopterin-guanine dinucleotide biosynthesis protein A